MIFRTPDELWALFASYSIPKGAPPVQRAEMRKAFLGGMLSLLGALRELPADADEAEAERELNAMWETLSDLLDASAPPPGAQA